LRGKTKGAYGRGPFQVGRESPSTAGRVWPKLHHARRSSQPLDPSVESGWKKRRELRNKKRLKGEYHAGNAFERGEKDRRGIGGKGKILLGPYGAHSCTLKNARRGGRVMGEDETWCMEGDGNQGLSLLIYGSSNGNRQLGEFLEAERKRRGSSPEAKAKAKGNQGAGKTTYYAYRQVFLGRINSNEHRDSGLAQYPNGGGVGSFHPVSSLFEKKGHYSLRGTNAKSGGSAKTFAAISVGR